VRKSLRGGPDFMDQCKHGNASRAETSRITVMNGSVVDAAG
jgi:hypothetical protein